MSRKANSTAVGIFIIAGFFLAVAALVFFGSVKLFKKTETFICYFDEPVNGLDIGSPVKFRGVPIGKVKKIYIRFNQSENTDHIPVVIELDISLLNNSLGVDVDIRDPETFLQLINLGYRAQLVTESFITGLKYIEIDIDEDAGRPIFVQEKVIYKEIPTQPSLTAQLGKSAQEVFLRLGSLDFQSLNDELTSVLSRAREGLEEIDFAGLNHSFNQVAVSAVNFLESPKLEEAIDTFNRTLQEYENLAVKIKDKVDPTLTEARETNEVLQRTLREVAKAAAQVEFILSSESSLRYRVEKVLAEFTETAEAVRLLAEYLERNPKALLTGKKQPAAEKKK